MPKDFHPEIVCRDDEVTGNVQRSVEFDGIGLGYVILREDLERYREITATADPKLLLSIWMRLEYRRLDVPI